MKNISALLALLGFLMISALSGTATGEETEFKPHFTLRIFGGLGYQSLHDLNSGSEGLSGFSVRRRFYFSVLAVGKPGNPTPEWGNGSLD